MTIITNTHRKSTAIKESIEVRIYFESDVLGSCTSKQTFTTHSFEARRALNLAFEELCNKIHNLHKSGENVGEITFTRATVALVKNDGKRRLCLWVDGEELDEMLYWGIS